MSPTNIFHPRYVKKLNHCFRITRFDFNYFDHSFRERRDECIIFFPYVTQKFQLNEIWQHSNQINNRHG